MSNMRTEVEIQAAFDKFDDLESQDDEQSMAADVLAWVLGVYEDHPINDMIANIPPNS